MSFFIDNEFKKIKRKYNLTTPKDLLDQAHVGLLEIPLDDNTGGFTVTNNRCSTIVINSLWESHHQAFVILHEFAHHRLHGWSSTPFFRRVGVGNYTVPKIEREANELAMDMLLAMQNSDEINRLTKQQLINYLGISPDLIDFIK